MFSKNVYLIVALAMFVLLSIVYFENMTYGTTGIVFLFDVSGSASIANYIWPLALISGVLGASVTIYIQKLMEDMSVDEQAGGLNI